MLHSDSYSSIASHAVMVRTSQHSKQFAY